MLIIDKIEIAPVSDAIIYRIARGVYSTTLPYHSRKTDINAWRAYYDDQNRLDLLFQEDALKEVGLSNHPKKDKIFSYAWQKGHSAGYSEVYGNLIDLAEIFIDELDK